MKMVSTITTLLILILSLINIVNADILNEILTKFTGVNITQRYIDNNKLHDLAYSINDSNYNVVKVLISINLKLLKSSIRT